MEANKHYVSVRMRLLPGSKRKAVALAQTAGVCRYVKRAFIFDLENAYKAHVEDPDANPKPELSFFSLAKRFTQWRRAQEEDWIRDIPSSVVRYNLKSISDTYQRYFESKGAAGKPKPPSKYRDKSFQVHCGSSSNTNWLVGDRLNIPGAGRYRIRGSNRYEHGRLRDYTVKQTLGRWYVTLRYEVETPVVETDPANAVGLDLGVAQTVTTSDGEFYNREDAAWRKQKEARIKRYQRQLARQVKGSNRRQKTKTWMSKRFKELAGRRNDFAHKVSRTIVDQYDHVVMEDLKLANMTKSAKGTIENPGKNVKAKAGLNRSLLDQSLGKIRQHIEDKCARASKATTKVAAQYTSQQCSRCGEVNKASRLTQSQYRCVSCGYEANADMNAALNILARGIGATGRGGLEDGLPCEASTRYAGVLRYAD